MSPALVVIAATLAGASACVTCSGASFKQTLEQVDLGDVDFHALAGFDRWVGEKNYQYLAVGDDGTVAVWGQDYDPDVRMFVERFDVGDEDLHDVLIVGESWWAVGDGGTLAVSDNYGASWAHAELAGGKNLHAIAWVDGRVVIVGDEALLVRMPDGTWLEPTPPQAGWGDLRAVELVGARIYAAGLGGVMWAADDPTADWIADPSGVTTDLFDLGTYKYLDVAIAVGAQGTVLVRRTDGWAPLATGVGVDLLDYDATRILARGGDVYLVGEPLHLFDSLPGALAIGYDDYNDSFASVGEDGAATMTVDHFCE